MTEISRRYALLNIALSAAGAASLFGADAIAAGPPKLAQKSVAYRPKPDGDRKCDNCKLFVKPNACEKVDGDISPDGYCILYQKA